MGKQEKVQIDKKKENVVDRKKHVVGKKVSKKSEKRENIFKKIGKYFHGVGKEIQRIRWTSGRDLVKYSIATVVFVLFFGIYFYGIDWIALLVRSLAK